MSTAVTLARGPSLPIVASNVLAAIALAGAAPAASTIALACAAMLVLYVSGCLLDDAFDRELDRLQHPARPIPAGDARAAFVFDLGFVLLGAGVALVAVAALATGAGARPVVSAVALATLVVFYVSNHHGNRWAPVLLGLCRAGVYTTVALLVRRDLCAEVVVGAALAAAYLVALASTARVKGALGAGLALLDALLAALLGRTDLALASLGCFAVALALHAALRDHGTKM